MAMELPSRAGAAHPSQRQSLGLTCAPRVPGGAPLPQPGWSSRDALPQRTDLGSGPRVPNLRTEAETRRESQTGAGDPGPGRLPDGEWSPHPLKQYKLVGATTVG